MEPGNAIQKLYDAASVAFMMATMLFVILFAVVVVVVVDNRLLAAVTLAPTNHSCI